MAVIYECDWCGFKGPAPEDRSNRDWGSYEIGIPTVGGDKDEVLRVLLCKDCCGAWTDATRKARDAFKAVLEAEREAAAERRRTRTDQEAREMKRRFAAEGR